jgi:hypothetical protein
LSLDKIMLLLMPGREWRASVAVMNSAGLAASGILCHLAKRTVLLSFFRAEPASGGAMVQAA